MNRLDFLKNLGILSAGATIFPKYLSTLAKSPFTELRNGVGMFSLQGGTIGWYTTDGAIVVVDSQFPDPARAFVDGISAFGNGPHKVLFNSHHHGDHTGGNLVFEQDGYSIIAHANVPDLQRTAAQNSDNEENQAYASTTFADQFSFDAGDETITAKHYGPAHTKGDSVIWFENANIAHMGDLVFNRIYPFIDRNGGAIISGWINLLETVAGEADSETLFIFGHGNPEFGVTGSREILLHKRDFLSHLLEYTREGIAAGKSREEITARTSFDEFPDHLSPSDFLSLPRNLDVAWLELTES